MKFNCYGGNASVTADFDNAPEHVLAQWDLLLGAQGTDWWDRFYENRA